VRCKFIVDFYFERVLHIGDLLELNLHLYLFAAEIGVLRQHGDRAESQLAFTLDLPGLQEGDDKFSFSQNKVVISIRDVLNIYDKLV
jgi:hypothetical protein